MKIIPSLLDASQEWKKMKVQLTPLVKKNLISGVHVDAMDGEFVENYTLNWLNAELVALLRKAFPKLFIEVHLMVQNPENYVDIFAKAGANRIWWHVEAKKNGKKMEKIKQKWKRVEFGPVLNPETSEKKLTRKKFACVLVMSVHPGKGGQKFIEKTLKKIEKIRTKYRHTTISVDGGVNAANIAQIAAAGANEAVPGTAVFKGNPTKNALALKQRI